MCAALKNVCNVRVYDISLDHKRLLLRVTGPQEPGAFHLYDREARRLHLISVTRPWLEPKRLAAMEALKVTTRDGAQVDAYLSVPPGALQDRAVLPEARFLDEHAARRAEQVGEHPGG